MRTRIDICLGFCITPLQGSEVAAHAGSTELVEPVRVAVDGPGAYSRWPLAVLWV
jgi:hypothetical protein